MNWIACAAAHGANRREWLAARRCTVILGQGLLPTHPHPHPHPQDPRTMAELEPTWDA